MQKGFIFPSLYIYLGLGAVIAFLYLRNEYLSVKVDLAESRYETFVDDVGKIGKEAIAKNKKIEAENKLKKERADAERKTLLNRNAELSKRLSEYSRGDFLPRSSAPTGKPETTCLSRPDANRAIREFIEEVSGLTAEGHSAIGDLDNAKVWSQSQ